MPAQSQAYGVAQLITLLVLFVIIIALAYLAAKWFGNYQKSKGPGGNIEIIETFRLAPSRFIAIFRIGKRYFAVAVGKDEMSLLTELNEDELALRPQGSAEAVRFKDILDRIRGGKGEQ